MQPAKGSWSQSRDVGQSPVSLVDLCTYLWMVAEKDVPVEHPAVSVGHSKRTYYIESELGDLERIYQRGGVRAVRRPYAV